MEKHRKESIKNTVLKHEEVFKQQVQELHRLYEVQKKLMSDVRSKTLKKKISFLAASNPHVITGSKNKIRNIKSTSETSHCSHATVLNHSTDVPNSEYTSTLPFSTDESSRELNYCLGEPLKRSREYNFQQPAEGDSHDSCSGLDLTLSIGCATDMNTKTDWKRMPNDSSLLLSPDLNMPDRIQEYTNSAAGFSLESLQRPYWLFQALSLNKT